MGGTQRMAKFVKYLPQFGWKPYVVTVKDIVYFAKDESLLADVRDADITRTGSLDPQRLLARFAFGKPQSAVARKASGSKVWRTTNRLLQWVFVPDAKVLWLPFALYRAWKRLRSENIDCVLTSAPPHASQLLGFALKKMTKIPWVADFRDGWAHGNFQTRRETGFKTRRRHHDRLIRLTRPPFRPLRNVREDSYHYQWI